MVRRDADFMRRRATVLYRALRDDCGTNGATAGELMLLIDVNELAGVFMALEWLRAHGVDVVCARAGDGSSPSRWALRSALPESWDALLPA